MSVKRLLGPLSLAIVGAASSLTTAWARDIDFEKFTLANGLRVVVHEDRKAPVVAVGVWYHVGSKDEPRGKAGFAHLFEHLMFGGSENFSGAFFDTLSSVGASNINGTTSVDRTSYYETVPTPALELALWLESDRMGRLLGAVTQSALNDERSVVQNEKRQREGQPYGMLNERTMQGLFPDGHPYHHSTIGSMEELAGAAVDDVHNWFKQYYGAANALVVLSGDIDVETARVLMTKYFGDIAPGPPLRKLETWIPERGLDTREVMFDAVGQVVIQRAWAVPGFGSEDRSLLDVVAATLGGGQTSPLYRKLVAEHGLATNVSASLIPNQIASVFVVSVSVRDGIDPAQAEQGLDEVMEKFLTDGPSQAELDKNKNNIQTALIRGMESVQLKGELLAEGELYMGDADFVNVDIERTRSASRAAVLQVARRWLAKGFHQVSVLPFGPHRAEETGADRSKPPVVENTLVLDLPEMQEATLSNGIKLVLAERHETQTVSLALVFNSAGSVAEPDAKPGVAGATFALMNEGPAGLSASAFADKKEELGADIAMSGGVHAGVATVSALKKNLRASLALWVGTIRHPAFREDDWERMRVNALQQMESAKNDPNVVAGRILMSVAYGPAHPYATRWDEVQAMNSLARADFEQFHAISVRPDGAILLAVGAIDMPSLVAQLEQAFQGWAATKSPTRPVQAIADVPVPDRPRVILVDMPNLPQTTIVAGRLVPSSRDKNALAFDAVNNALGGGLSGRIGVNLRMRKGWSYGAGSSAGPALAQRLWRVSAPVQSDKTTPAVVELLHEITALSADQPISAEELSLFVRSRTFAMPGMFESASAVLATMVDGAAYGWAFDWIENQKHQLDSLTVEEVNRVARDYVKPGALTWVVVGDLATFERQIRELRIGDVEIWNADGKRIR